MGVFLQERSAFYAELVDMNSQVLLDESKKIEPKDYQDDAEMLQSPIFETAIRKTQDDPDFMDCLINMDTLKIVTFDELLNAKISSAE